MSIWDFNMAFKGTPVEAPSKAIAVSLYLNGFTIFTPGVQNLCESISNHHGRSELFYY